MSPKQEGAGTKLRTGTANVDHKTSKTKTEQKREVMDIEKPRMNHYCYSIDLRSVKNLDIDHPINCFCR